MSNLNGNSNKLVKWTSKLGVTYIEGETDFDATAIEIKRVKDLPANKRCAECNVVGTVWSSVNLGVFTCMRCGSLHRALGTHISKPKGCTGTYLWSPDEVQQMKEIGNAKAQEIYGGEEHRPAEDAPYEVWLEYLRDKYERRRWAKGEVPGDTNCSAKHKNPVTTQDLLGLKGPTAAEKKADNKSFDFFAEFDL